MKSSPSRPVRLSRASLETAVDVLATHDPALGHIIAAHGSPPLWSRRPGFATLARIVLEQQVSLASAAALYRRVEGELPAGWTPGSVLAVGELGLRARGLTRQMARYVTELAARIESGALRLSRFSRAEDRDVEGELCSVPGIGPWSASIYLLMALGRPDIWPPGDLALLKALAKLRRSAQMPSSDEAARYATRWAPYRAVAARILWHGYLAERAA